MMTSYRMPAGVRLGFPDVIVEATCFPFYNNRFDKQIWWFILVAYEPNGATRQGWTSHSNPAIRGQCFLSGKLPPYIEKCKLLRVLWPKIITLVAQWSCIGMWKKPTCWHWHKELISSEAHDSNSSVNVEPVLSSHPWLCTMINIIMFYVQHKLHVIIEIWNMNLRYKTTLNPSINNKTLKGNTENNTDISEHWAGRIYTVEASDSGLYWACKSVWHI